MTADQLEFATFCIGNVAEQLQLPQSEVYKRLNDSAILSDFIVKYYDELHTYGRRYLVNEIVELMTEKGVA